MAKEEYFCIASLWLSFTARASFARCTEYDQAVNVSKSWTRPPLQPMASNALSCSSLCRVSAILWALSISSILTSARRCASSSPLTPFDPSFHAEKHIPLTAPFDLLASSSPYLFSLVSWCETNCSTCRSSISILLSFSWWSPLWAACPSSMSRMCFSDLAMPAQFTKLMCIEAVLSPSRDRSIEECTACRLRASRLASVAKLAQCWKVDLKSPRLPPNSHLASATSTVFF
mmetsp:Transcript_44126/g.137395  ORF Transcript_44126/g.137395 Transcript_44126/m.137395 type:complete len:231 (+) Transcript_44126:1125-1817(+)